MCIGFGDETVDSACVPLGSMMVILELTETGGLAARWVTRDVGESDEKRQSIKALSMRVTVYTQADGAEQPLRRDITVAM